MRQNRKWIALALVAGVVLLLVPRWTRWSRDRASAQAVTHAIKVAIEQITPAHTQFQLQYHRLPKDNQELGLAPAHDPIWQGFERVELFDSGDIHFEFHNAGALGGDPQLLVWHIRPRRFDAVGTPVFCGAQNISQRALDWSGLHCDQDVKVAPPGSAAAQARVAATLPQRATTQADEVIAAVEHDNAAELESLRARGVDLCQANPDGQTPLLSAVRGNQTKSLPVLLAAHCDLNQIEPFSSRSALMVAAAGHNVELVQQLLLAGADPRLSSPASDSAWFLAGTDSDPLSRHIREMLMVKGVEVNTAAADGATLLMRAAQAGNLGLADWLIAQGANLDLQDSSGRSALMHATLSPSGETVLQLLLARGAAVNLKDRQGSTALALAQSAVTEPRRQSRMIRLLQTAGGKA